MAVTVLVVDGAVNDESKAEASAGEIVLVCGSSVTVEPGMSETVTVTTPALSNSVAEELL
jgi:hypothetical protein